MNDFLDVALSLLKPVVETDNIERVDSPTTYTIKLDIPGVRKEDLALDFTDTVMSVKWTRRGGDDPRRYGQFSQKVKLPFVVMGRESVTLSLDSGVLSVSFDKSRTVQTDFNIRF